MYSANSGELSPTSFILSNPRATSRKPTSKFGGRGLRGVVTRDLRGVVISSHDNQLPHQSEEKSYKSIPSPSCTITHDLYMFTLKFINTVWQSDVKPSTWQSFQLCALSDHINSVTMLVSRRQYLWTLTLYIILMFLLDWLAMTTVLSALMQSS